jgi:hypothetical protein
MAALRDASELLWPAVAETLTQLGLGPEDAAVRKLAQRYAQIIDQAADEAWAMRWIGPLLLDCLTELSATPAARARLAKGDQRPDAKPAGLAKLRAAR